MCIIIKFDEPNLERFINIHPLVKIKFIHECSVQNSIVKPKLDNKNHPWRLASNPYNSNLCFVYLYHHFIHLGNHLERLSLSSIWFIHLKEKPMVGIFFFNQTPKLRKMKRKQKKKLSLWRILIFDFFPQFCDTKILEIFPQKNIQN
jgi:hypothetical protein